MAYLKYTAIDNDTVYIDIATGVLVSLNHVQKSVNVNGSVKQLTEEDFEQFEATINLDT